MTDWLGDFLSVQFLRIYKRHELLTVLANSMWWEVDGHQAATTATFIIIIIIIIIIILNFLMTNFIG